MLLGKLKIPKTTWSLLDALSSQEWEPSAYQAESWIWAKTMCQHSESHTEWQGSSRGTTVWVKVDVSVNCYHVRNKDQKTICCNSIVLLLVADSFTQWLKYTAVACCAYDMIQYNTAQILTASYTPHIGQEHAMFILWKKKVHSTLKTLNWIQCDWCSSWSSHITHLEDKAMQVSKISNWGPGLLLGIHDGGKCHQSLLLQEGEATEGHM